MITADVVVLLFGGRRPPRPLAGLAAQTAEGRTTSTTRRPLRTADRGGSDADVAAVLTRLLRADRLDVEVGHATGWWAARRATPRHRAPGAVDPRRDRPRHRRVGRMARQDGAPLHGEAVVDDTQLFDGEVAGVRMEPTQAMPGLRACVIRPGRRRWVAGRAAQLGTPGAAVVRDGTGASKIVRRSTFYRHTQGWLLVR